MQIKNTFYRFATASLLAFSLVAAHNSASADPVSIIYPMANAIIRPETIEKVAKELVVAALQKNLKANLDNNTISIQSDPIKEALPLPTPTGELKQILDTFGISEKLSISTSPIKASFTLPDSSLKIDISNKADHSYDIQVSLTITDISATVDSFGFDVPKGAFDRAFALVSSPVQIGLKGGSKSVTVIASLSALINKTGTSFTLNSFKTNLLSKNGPTLFVTLGPLTAGGKPFQPTLIANGHSMVGSEKEIRNQLTAAAGLIAAQPPFSYSLNTSDLLKGMKLDPSLNDFLSGIGIDFLFSDLAPMHANDAFNAQISSRVFFDSEPLTQVYTASAIGADDLKSFKADDEIGVILYESFVKQFVESVPFEARIHDYFGSLLKNQPGINLSQSGVRVYFDPAQNSVAAVINLEIDLKKLITSSTSEMQAIELEAGDKIEDYFGTGKLIQIPIEMNFKLGGVTSIKGVNNFVINTELPFNVVPNANPKKSPTVTFIPTVHCSMIECPSNLEDMTSLIAKFFYPQLQQQLASTLPAKINVPISKPITYGGLEFYPTNLAITPNSGLILTAKTKPAAPVPASSPATTLTSEAKQ